MGWAEEASIHRFCNDGIFALSYVTHCKARHRTSTLLCLGLFGRAKCKVPFPALDAFNVLLGHIGMK